MYNFITIGYDCSPAAALRNLDKRPFALPFDWVQSNISCIEECIKDNFKKYHTNLHLNYIKSRLIDAYGFQFPHDYPLVDMSGVEDHIGEGIFEEKPGSKVIVDNWQSYYETVKEKYNRRIERFINIVNDPAPIIVLCRYSTDQALSIKDIFHKYYNKDNVYIVNSCSSPYETKLMINVYTEKNGIWNECALWKQAIDKIISVNEL